MRQYTWILAALLLTACATGELQQEAASTSPPDLAIEEGIHMPEAIDPPQEMEPAPEEEVPEPKKTAYITIDDGPSELVTPRILDILKEHDIRATFFVLPKHGLEHIVERMIAEGHQLGNHTYSHNYDRLYGGACQLFREDVLRARAYLEETFDYETHLFRFPGGSKSWDPSAIAVRREILAELQYRDFDWDISIGDTDPSPAGRDPKVFVAKVNGNLKDQEKVVILMHDSAGKTATVEALPEIIGILRESGYDFDVLGNYFEA